MAPLFWIVTTLDAALFVGLLVAGLAAKGIADGGREMSIAGDRWDLVLLLIARGANASRSATNGTHLADVVQSRVESTSDRPPEMKADIARVKAQLSTSRVGTSR